MRSHPSCCYGRTAPSAFYYAPWDWVNTDAKVMLVGITAGRHQAEVALGEARRLLLAGASTEEALRSAVASGAFAGSMRTNLIRMLDGIGLAGALHIDSSSQLFDSHFHMVANASAIGWPVFVKGGQLQRLSTAATPTSDASVLDGCLPRHAGGHGPGLCRHPLRQVRAGGSGVARRSRLARRKAVSVRLSPSLGWKWLARAPVRGPSDELTRGVAMAFSITRSQP